MLWFFNGHTCEVEGEAEWVDRAVRLPILP